jgi:hypothetical protein
VGEAASRTGILTTRFDEAVSYALDAHDSQHRKGGSIPYAAHLLGVASLVLESGGTETEAIAALLHDVVEDQGGARRQAAVAARFGDEIARIVHECSADDKTDDPGWRPRKERYIAAVATISPSALLVSLADKLHNARSILDDYRALGHKVWAKFGADEPKDEAVLWLYRSLVEAYRARGDDAPRRLLGELERTVAHLGTLVRRPNCPSCRAGDVARVVWGQPSSADFETAEEQDVAYGGCNVEPDSADYRCRVCGFSWYAGLGPGGPRARPAASTTGRSDRDPATGGAP